VILDTNAVSALFTGDPGLERLLARQSRLALPVIVIGEYRFGLLRSKLRQTLEPLLATLIRESDVLLVDEGTADAYAQLREELRSKSRPIPENDLWIASLALQHRQPVVSRDGHFDELPRIVRLSW
jgi:predicted nucleic acid-binding protein